MSKPRRNKALAVLDARLGSARKDHELALARVSEAEALVTELQTAREAVARAYERKTATGAGKKRGAMQSVTPTAKSDNAVTARDGSRTGGTHAGTFKNDNPQAVEAEAGA